MATIQDVAKLAGVSTATVSRVLNNNYKVSERRKKLVLDAVKALNYQPNIIGRNLSRSENRTILVVSGSIHNGMLRGAHQAAAELGYDVILSYSPTADESEALKYFNNGFAGGIIIMGFRASDSTLEELIKNYPVVMCAEYMDIPEANLVSIHDDKACYDLTAMLIEQGRRRFGFMAPKGRPGHTINFAKVREEGFRRALQDYDIPYYPELVFKPDNVTDYLSRVELAQLYVDMGPEKRPDAIICAQDSFGVACINTFKNAGIRVPDDIAVTGYDNSEISVMCSPALTTVDQPFVEMGAESARMLISIMNNEKNIQRRIFLDHKLMIRGSTDKTKQ